MSNLVFLIAGARPNFMKIAPLIKQFEINNIEYKLIHTGQHYDYNMSKIFFDNLGIPEPDIYLNVGSASHAVQTAKIMIEFEKVLLEEKPQLVIVVGDVNSTIACALVAKKIFIKVAHVEAGLRSFDFKMPEEINRILTDQISDYLFTTEKSGEINLRKEGISPEKIFFVGNIMIDNLLMNLERSNNIDVLKKYKLEKKKYALVTCHRPSNVDHKDDLEKIVEILSFIQKKIKIFFPVHPRTKMNLKKFDLISSINKANIITNEPVGFLDFLNLMLNSRFILTDSGGIQEEASYLNIPVLTIREKTERPITVEKGTNTIVNKDFKKIKKYVYEIFSNNYKNGQTIEKWDGQTAKRITKIIMERCLTK
ncbi:MAG: non-hydrolyzing UDP-N-acetylglucosamine 2-epimerase [Promethearchaeota archaeon]